MPPRGLEGTVDMAAEGRAREGGAVLDPLFERAVETALRGDFATLDGEVASEGTAFAVAHECVYRAQRVLEWAEGLRSASRSASVAEPPVPAAQQEGDAHGTH